MLKHTIDTAINLTSNQTEFLTNNSISTSRVLDATGLQPKIYKSLMKDLDKDLAIGVTICNRGHDSMRTRAGHCIFCNPQAILHQNRFKQEAYTYLAISASCKLIKIGFSENPPLRESKLKTEGYGGAKDWTLISHFRCKNAGRAEYQIQHSLSQYSYPTQFNKDGHEILCKETFKCSTAIAIKNFLTAPIDDNRDDVWMHPEIDQIGFDVLNFDMKNQTPTKKWDWQEDKSTDEENKTTQVPKRSISLEVEKPNRAPSQEDLAKGELLKQWDELMAAIPASKVSPQHTASNNFQAQTTSNLPNQKKDTIQNITKNDKSNIFITVLKWLVMFALILTCFFQVVNIVTFLGQWTDIVSIRTFSKIDGREYDQYRAALQSAESTFQYQIIFHAIEFVILFIAIFALNKARKKFTKKSHTIETTPL